MAQVRPASDLVELQLHGRDAQSLVRQFELSPNSRDERLLILIEGLIADFLPTPTRLGCILAAQHPLGGGQQAKNYRVLFIGEPGFDDKAAELDLAAGIKPSVGINYPLHLNSILP
jgi:hypothetical protein